MNFGMILCILISYPKNSLQVLFYQVNENAFLILHIPSGRGAGDCVVGEEGTSTEGVGDPGGDSTGGICSFTGVSAGKMLHKSWQFVLRKPI